MAGHVAACCLFLLKLRHCQLRWSMFLPPAACMPTVRPQHRTVCAGERAHSVACWGVLCVAIFCSAVCCTLQRCSVSLPARTPAAWCRVLPVGVMPVGCRLLLSMCKWIAAGTCEQHMCATAGVKYQQRCQCSCFPCCRSLTSSSLRVGFCVCG